jgi:hypothetical protein
MEIARTYELYLVCHDGRKRFQALTSPSSEMLGRAQAILDKSGAERAELHEFGRHLVTLSSAKNPHGDA